jgi:LysM repeat protein
MSSTPKAPLHRQIGKAHGVLLGMAIGGGLFVVAAGLVFAAWRLLPGLIQSQPTIQASSATSQLPAAPPSTLIPTPSPQPSVTPTPIPSLTPTPAQTATPAPFIYIVQENDTLYSIALRFDTSVGILVAVNHLTSSIIYIDQELLIAWDLPAVIPGSAATAISSPSGTVYLVSPGDTLESIANAYSLEVPALRTANHMAGDALLPGQQLLIPPAGELPGLPAYQFSVLEGDLAAAYPLAWETSRFTLHYALDTFVAIDPLAVSELVSNGLVNDEYLFQTTLVDHFDVYAAGSIFEPPSRALRGRSYSYELRYHFLHDGSGNAADQQYIATHELTHLFTWNVFGMPASTMLSEGAATYAGMAVIAGSAHLPLETFCAAYLQAGALPSVSSSLSYNGHNIDLENYYASGCFVGYLLQAYGPAAFAQLYPSGDYLGIYGQSLSGLEADWRAYTVNLPIPAWLDAAALVTQVNALTTTYENFFPYFYGTPAQMEAYYYLDQARLALLEARLSDTAALLQTFNEKLAQP